MKTLDGQTLETRLIEFSVRVIRVADALPRSNVGRHVSNQLLRSGTSPAANYAEARAAESRADFVHKLKIVHKELNETHVWLRIIARAKLIDEPKLVEILRENDELCRVIGKSVTTSKSNAGKAKQVRQSGLK